MDLCFLRLAQLRHFYVCSQALQVNLGETKFSVQECIIDP